MTSPLKASLNAASRISSSRASLALPAGGRAALTLLALAAIAAMMALGRGVLTEQPAPDYVFVAAASDGLQVLDAADPAAPQPAGAAQTGGSAADLDVLDGRAYVAAGSAGLVVLDVRAPETPDVLGTLGLEARAVAVKDVWAYVLSERGLHVVDAADPSQPAQAGFLQGAGSAVAVAGQHAYLASTIGLRVVDVSSPSDPTQTALLTGRVDDVVISDTLAVVAAPFAGLQTIDVGQPSEPRLLGTLPLGGLARAVAIHGTRAYVTAAARDTGAVELSVVDITDPAAPKQLGVLDLAGAGNDLAAAEGRLLYVADGDGGLQVVDVSDPAAPAALGGRRLGDAAQAVARPRTSAGEQPTATPTATGTDVVTATVTATETATARPSETDTATPRGPATATPTRVPLPRGTRDPAARWERYTGANSALPDGRLHRVTVDDDGTAWARVTDPRGGPDRLVAARPRGPWMSFRSIRDAVRQRYDEIVERGGLVGLWAVDVRDQVWVGPELFDGRRWRAAVRDERRPLGGVRHAGEAISAGGGTWVPVGSALACQRPTGCAADGLRVFDAEASFLFDVSFDPVPEAARFGLPAVRLLPAGGQGVDARAWAVTSGALYALPDQTPIRYPSLGDLFQQRRGRNAGYASAAAADDAGRLAVITWLELHEQRFPRRLEYRHVLNLRDGDQWQTVDLSDGPLFAGRNRTVRVVAADYGPAGALWLATSTGELGVWRDGQWLDHFDAADSPLRATTRVRDLDIGPRGTVWVVTDEGLLAYGLVEAPRLPPPPSIYAPYTVR